MSFESPQSDILSYEDWDYQRLEADEKTSPVLQKVALKYLRTKDKDFFDREFTGEMNSEGHLINKDGTIGPKPSQTVGAAGMEWVTEETRNELAGVGEDARRGTIEGDTEVEGGELKDEIERATDMAAIYSALQKSGGIQGSGKFYTFDEIKDIIGDVWNGKDDRFLTNTYGLRTKIKGFMAEEERPKNKA